MKWLLWITLPVCISIIFFIRGNNTHLNVEDDHKSMSPEHATGRDYHPKRILCFTPSISETIYALGGGDRIAGVSSYVSYPPESLQKPFLGGHLNPNFEKIMALAPDLVVFQGASDTIMRFCNINDINVLRVTFRDIDSIFKEMQMLGDIIGETDRATKLCDTLRFELDAIRAKVATLPRKKVFFTFDRIPGELGKIYSTNHESFISELMSIAGGDNIFSGVKSIYPQISLEALLKHAPDVIIEMKTSEMVDQKYTDQFIADWQVLESVPAVIHKEIHIVSDSALIVPGPRIVIACKLFAKILHPEVFSE
jgi:iron complex transport system substrate-binding protein